MTRQLSWRLSVLLSAVLACDSTKSAEPLRVSSFAMLKPQNDFVVEVGGGPKFGVVVLDQSGRDASSWAKVEWESRNPAVATVDPTGQSHALSPGDVVIIVRLVGSATPAADSVSFRVSKAAP
jgi:hypothetical protein